MEAYISEFQRLFIMVIGISEKRLVILFMEGLYEPMRGWFKAFDSPTLQEAMRKAHSMELVAPRSKFSYGSSSSKDIKSFPKKKKERQDGKEKKAAPWDRETLNDLQRKKLCFYCKGPYDANHDCPLRPKGKENRVMWAFVEDSKSDQQSNSEDSRGKHEEEKSENEEEQGESSKHLGAHITSIQ